VSSFRDYSGDRDSSPAQQQERGGINPVLSRGTKNEYLYSEWRKKANEEVAKKPEEKSEFLSGGGLFQKKRKKGFGQNGA